MSQGLVYAVVGATGAVGKEVISILAERQVEVRELRLLASSRSAGSEVEFGTKSLVVRELTADAFDGVDIAFFAAGGDVSKEFVPVAVEKGVTVIDKSSAFRMVPEVPLIVPEVNADVLRQALKARKNGRGLCIATPNCSTIQLVVVLKPLMDRAGLKRVVVSTYQSVSGAGKAGMEELWEQTRGIFGQEVVKPQAFKHKIAFNLIPHIDSFLEDGYTKEEAKLTHESRKILSNPKLKLTGTAVRVPVFVCHSESVNIEFERELTPDDARDLLAQSPGIVVVDDPAGNKYPMNTDAGGTDPTYVGRIRKDDTVPYGLNMWIVADNLRKGAALNAVQIAEVVAGERAKH